MTQPPRTVPPQRQTSLKRPSSYQGKVPRAPGIEADSKGRSTANSDKEPHLNHLPGGTKTLKELPAHELGHGS